MGDCDDNSSYDNGLGDSSSSVIYNKRGKDQHTKKGLDSDPSSSHPLSSNDTTQTQSKSDQISAPVSRATATSARKKTGESQKVNITNRTATSTEPYCHVKLNSIITLKDSTKKLLNLLDDIQRKARISKHGDHIIPKTLNLSNPIPAPEAVVSVTDICASALKKLENQTKILDTLTTEDVEDDCSIFKRLTRKCNCLNQKEYNDFVIHFNEETKYYTSTSGEVIKNLRIVKKFLYMGGNYTKHALIFLNEGLSDSSYTEKVEITQGCAHSDMCNVFDDVSIVITCIAWPYKYDSYGDSVTQELAATLLNKLAQIEEGRRYLKFTSKITIDIKRVLKKKGSKLNFNTIESLHATLDAMDPHNLIENVNVAYYSRPGDEGFGLQTMKALIYYRQYMTLNEILTHLDLLYKMSSEYKGKMELATCLRGLVILFKNMLMEYDDSEMNIIVTNILNNIVSKDALEDNTEPKLLTFADTATEPIHKKNQSNQIPVPSKSSRKKNTKSRITLKEKSRQNFNEKSRLTLKDKSRNRLNNSPPKAASELESKSLKKPGLAEKHGKHRIIVVPVEK